MVAIQDGDGAWAAAPPNRGVYRCTWRRSATAWRRLSIRGLVAGQRVQRTAADGLDLRTRSCGTDAIELDVAVH